ncbi:MAG: tyrosine--tRNA ligase [bacterium]|nr:tyrosine--tRNA ligase [bacterium]
MQNQQSELIRGAIEAIDFDRVLQKIGDGVKLRIKHGWDPTAPDLHLGYTVPYQVLKRFQDLGHTVILLVGDFTTSIGDPTDQDVTRPRLSKEVIDKNIENGLRQIGKVLNVQTLEVRRNSEWFGGMNLSDFLGIASRVTAVRLWERDMFQNRLKTGGTVWTHEFLYPILQAYDSVMLKSDLTVIGSDQIFNELLGRELQRAMHQEPQAIVAMPILPGTDGKRKMSQSLGNYIGIAESPDQQFGKTMSVPDSALSVYLRLLTDIPESEILSLEKGMRSGAINPRDVKARLGREIVARFYDSEAALEAEKRFSMIFSSRQTPEDMKECTVKPDSETGTIHVADLLCQIGLAQSKNEARRLVKQGAIKTDDSVINDPELRISIPQEGMVVSRARKNFVRVRFSNGRKEEA